MIVFGFIQQYSTVHKPQIFSTRYSRKGSSIKEDVHTEGEGGLSQMRTKSDKEGFHCIRTSAFVVGLPTCDFVNSGRLHLISQY